MDRRSLGQAALGAALLFTVPVLVQLVTWLAPVAPALHAGTRATLLFL